MLKQRLLTAAVLIPLFVWGVLGLPSHYFALLLAIVVMIAAVEWTRLAAFVPRDRAVFLLVMLVALGGVMLAPSLLALSPTVAALAVIGWVVALQWVRRYERGVDSVPRNPWARILIGVLVLWPAWLSLVALHGGAGPAYVLFVFVLVWAADSGAYFSGRRFGRRKLAPRVSPGKSWEGVSGGMVAALLAAWLGAVILGMSVAGTMAFIALCAVVVAMSVVGDLFESLFKREAGLKDSGRFLPGHGGALDRIDSITAAAPVFYLGLTLLGLPR